VKIQTSIALCFATFLIGVAASVSHAAIQLRKPVDPGPYCLDPRFPCDAQGGDPASGGGGGLPGGQDARCWVCGMDISTGGLTFRCKKASAGYSGCSVGANGCREQLPSCRPNL
jgi:hypothetical protein